MLNSKPLLICSLAALPLLVEGTRADDWTTVGSDAQRSSWVRASPKTSPSTVRDPDFRFLWKMQLSNESRSGYALTAPALLDFLISHRGFRSLAFVGGSSGGVFAIDTDLARMEWERHFSAGPSKTSPECPGGMTANLTRPTAAAMPSPLGFTARGRRSPASSGVGEPGEGAVTLQPATSSPARPPARQNRSARVRPPARRSLRGVTLVYALSADGMLHVLYVTNGRDRVPPIPFLPANANARGLIVVDGVAYVSTRGRCGGAADGVWGLDLDSGEVNTWTSDGGAVSGSGGVAFGPDGTLYAATEDGSLVALKARSLEQLAASEPVGFRSSPLVFDYRGADHVAAVARDGSLQVYSASNLGQAVATAHAGAGTGDPERALAAWRDSSGTHWILVPTAESIAAWKLTGQDNATHLAMGWESSRMESPLPPMIVNGVVFALDGGSASGTAKLHALEGTTGNPLWDSGNAIEATATGHALSSGPGQVYVTATDSAIYAFGFPMEH